MSFFVPQMALSVCGGAMVLKTLEERPGLHPAFLTVMSNNLIMSLPWPTVTLPTCTDDATAERHF